MRLPTSLPLPQVALMNSCLELLRVPINSVVTAATILRDSARDIWNRFKVIFRGGPVGELSEYWQMIKGFFRFQNKKLRAQLDVAKERLTEDSKTHGGRKSRRRR